MLTIKYSPELNIFKIHSDNPIKDFTRTENEVLNLFNDCDIQCDINVVKNNPYQDFII